MFDNKNKRKEAMKEKLLFCEKCNEFCTYTVKEVEETYPVKGEDVTVKAFVSYCKECGEELWNEELDEGNLLRAYDEYRKRHNLLSPAEIKSIREKYNISQVNFARVLGLGDKTVTRYENGNIPDKAQNNLILLAARPDNFKELVCINRSVLSDADYEKAMAAIDALNIKILCTKAKAKNDAYEYSDTAIIVTPYYFGGRKKDA